MAEPGRDTFAQMLAGMDKFKPSPEELRRRDAYTNQQAWRGLGDLAFSPFDIPGMVANAAIRDVDYLTGGGLSGGKYDPYQFPLTSDEAAEIAHEATGQPTIDPATLDPATLRTGERLRTGIATLPVGPEAVLPAIKAAATTPAMALGAMAKTWRHPISDVKLRRPLEEMSAGYNVTDPLLERPVVNPEELQGSVLTPAVGDRTIAGKELTSINEQPLETPVKLQGGPDFMRGPQQQAEGAMWAAGPGIITGLTNRLRRLAESGNPVNLVYSPMGAQSGDFSTMMTNAIAEQMKGAKVTKKAKREFDEDVRQRFTTEGLKGIWPGIDKLTPEWISGGGTGRAMLAKVMDLAKHANAGFPDIGSIRKAITEPALLDVGSGEAGYAMSKVDPEKLRVITDPAVPHETYPHQIGGGTYLGGLAEPVPRSVMFPDWYRTRPAGEPTSRQDRAFAMQDVAQEANQQWLDQIMQWLEKRRGQP